jgi:hypothetical protein
MSSPHRKALILLVKIFVITTMLLLRSPITPDSNSVSTPQSASVAQHSLPLPPLIAAGSNILAARQKNLNVTHRGYLSVRSWTIFPQRQVNMEYHIILATASSTRGL